MFGIEELVAEVCGLDEDAEYVELDEAVYEKFGITMEDFEKVAKALLPHTPIVEAAMSGSLYNAFVSRKHINTMLVRHDYSK